MKFLLIITLLALISIASSESAFWYTYGTDGTKGFLLDFIHRDDSIYTNRVRIAMYDINSSPIVHYEDFGNNQFSEPSDKNVYMGDNHLDPNGGVATGKVDGIDFDIQLSLDGRHMEFTNDWISWLPIILPNLCTMSSIYGTLTGTVDGHSYNVALAYSWYTVPDILTSKWHLISNMNDPDSGISFEIATMEVALGQWVGSAYICYEGYCHVINNPLTHLVSIDITTHGDETDFHGRFDDFHRSLDVVCTAPTNQFAHLSDEGKTSIHTSLFGKCSGRLYYDAAAHSFATGPTCLLERKE